MDPAHVEAATKNTIRLALARGYVSMDQLREALVIREQLESAGRATPLLTVLAGRYVRPDHHPELSEYYQRQLAALSASPTGSAPPEPPAKPQLPTKLDAPADVLSRSMEMAQRPPEHDSQKIQAFLRESERALQLQPTEEQSLIPDKVFVALARKAGYPPKEDLLTCRRVQLELRAQGGDRTLFEIVQDRALLDERRQRRFRRWAAQVTRKDEAPLEDESESPEAESREPRKVVLHQSAAHLTIPADVDGEILGHRSTPPHQVSPLAGAQPGAQPGAGAPVGAPVGQPAQPRKGGGLKAAARVLRESAGIVTRGVQRRVREKAIEDPDAASRQAVQLMLVAGLLCLVVGTAFGMFLGGRARRGAEPGPSPEPSLAVSPPPAPTPSRPTTTPAADAAWLRLRQAKPEDAAKAYTDFAIDHPADPRAADAQRVADLLVELDQAGGRDGRRVLGLILNRARALERDDPRGARLLYDAIREAGPATEAAEAAGRLRRELVMRDPRAKGPATQDESPVPAPSPSPSPEDGAVAPVPTPSPRPSASATPRPSASPSPSPRPSVEQRPSAIALWNVFAGHYDRKREPEASKAQRALAEAHPGLYAQAAAALLSFLREDFGAARDQLATLPGPKLEEAGIPWRVAEALVRASFYTRRYELARAATTRLREDEARVWRALIDGPFRASYPLAAGVLEGVSPEGAYRVITDVGIPAQDLTKLEEQLAKLPPEAQARRVDEARKRHKVLETLGEVLEAAIKAYRTLLKGAKTKDIHPTVYVFHDKAAFARFGKEIGVGSTESLLGFYMPYYRVLVFFDRQEGTSGGLSRDTVETLLHETFHQWLHLHVEGAPTWFNEGMAEYFSIGARITRKSLAYGVVPDRHPSRLDNIRSAIHGELSSPLPLRELLLLDHRSFMASQAAVNYAHSWGFVHFLGSTPAGRKLLVSYFKALIAGSNQEEAFGQVFGKLDLDAMDKAWRLHVLNLH
ncbi:MAG: DUF1570 domain-containing protein [Planctomycetota bacterium]